MNITGNCLDILPTLETNSIQCCVTSPPYYGLRDYGRTGQIGLEPTPEAYVEKLVAVFREVRRVLRDDGVLWLNLGDSYTGSANSGGANQNDGGLLYRGSGLPNKRGNGLKPKDLIGIPWMVAFALRKDGWYLRQDIIWAKPNPMPESVKDRCTKSHEYIFLLTKSARYYYDNEAISEQTLPSSIERYKTPIKIYGNKDGGSDRNDFGRNGTPQNQNTRNKRTVWNITTKPYKEAHFATFPPELPEICIKAGCPQGGTVLDPFAGAGTTLYVAEQLGRNSIGIELNPDYCDIIRRRMAGIEVI